MNKYLATFLLAAGVIFSSRAQEMVAYGPKKVDLKKAISVVNLYLHDYV